jgi:serine/threonine protein kinase
MSEIDFRYVLTGAIREDEYAQLLSSRKLWPVNADVEQNWSGRGQHVKFEPSEQHLINGILHLNEQLGSTSTAVVQSVKCRRILLARKTILCGKKMPRHVAIEEVSHLTRLSHAHILRVIGTYVKGRELSILLYPVAEYNLEGFFEKFHNTPSQSNSWLCMCHSGLKLYFCLSSALLCIHRSLTKHMDIKPQNILMRKTSEKGYYNAYIADFGIARSYATSEEIETDGRTSFTKRYAAPEVVRQETRGLSADVFSLGCVFLEIFSTFHSPNIRFRTQSALQTVFTANADGDLSYQANIAGLQAHLASLVKEFSHLKLNLVMIRRMLNSKPQERPTAEELVTFFEERPCCTPGPLQLQVMDDVQSEEVIEPNA